MQQTISGRKIILALVFGLWGGMSHANIPVSFKNVNYDDQYVSVESFILGRTCYSLKASRLSLDCNPAFMAGEERSDLVFNLNVDNNIKEVVGYVNDLQDRKASAVIDSILKHGKPITAYESLPTWWQQDWWAISLTPWRLGVAGVVVNPAYPTMSLHAAFQRELSMKGGFFFADNPQLRFGANLRWLQINQVRDEFALLSIPGQDYGVEIQDFKKVFFEPALNYKWRSEWDPEFSIILTHLPIYESKKDKQDFPRPEVGFSSHPISSDKRLRTSLHYTSRPDVVKVSERFRFGGIYEWSDCLSFNFSLAGESYGIGMMGRIDSLILGIGTKAEPIYYHGAEFGEAKTTLFQVGLAF